MPRMHARPTPVPNVSVRDEYSWDDAAPAHNHAFLLPTLARILAPGRGRSLIDLGCGNGALSAQLAALGYRTTGVDVAVSGVNQAQRAHSSVEFSEHDLGLPLPTVLRNRFDVAVAAEVIEHLFLPRELFRRADEALRPGGRLLITTPYHGWLKNVALSATNRMDQHWNPAWDYGHIKFFSRRSLTELAAECGYEVVAFHRVGRIPPLAMSMILALRQTLRRVRPGDDGISE